ncbi:oxidoreductase [Lentithecium fluviatile CBS 122367]|uniref:Oxidoreductase n=1 Tax=Lentithecium fluviatile CBS 122367 TaxID=1168545 RepID=A0A6G1JMI4_9PLEO|nr:oxidoreductase [Lentithecium fluviatile CBS 122367]
MPPSWPPFPCPTKIWRDNTYATLSPTRPELSAKGKTVIVTGGGTGIGAETARNFAEAGASRIGLLGRREQPLLDTKASIEEKFPGVEVLIRPTDITDKKGVDEAFAKFVGDGKLHILVHGAAMIGPQEPIKEVDGEKFLDAVQHNIRGSFWVAQAFLRHATNDATVIEINSSAAHMSFGAVFGCYSVAKMAVFRLWEAVAAGSPELRIFHVQPGVVATDMNKEAGGVEAIGFEDHVSLPATFSLWLASPEANFLKGKFLWANWDVDELKTNAKEIEEGTRYNIGLVGWPFSDAPFKFEGTEGSKWT